MTPTHDPDSQPLPRGAQPESDPSTKLQTPEARALAARAHGGDDGGSGATPVTPPPSSTPPNPPLSPEVDPPSEIPAPVSPPHRIELARLGNSVIYFDPSLSDRPMAAIVTGAGEPKSLEARVSLTVFPERAMPYPVRGIRHRSAAAAGEGSWAWSSEL